MSEGDDAPHARGLYRIWAITSSIACAGLGLYVLAAHVSGAPTDGPTPSASAPTQAHSSGSEAQATELPRPDPLAAARIALADLPREWISAERDPERGGHAALVDPAQRSELIVERCVHGGYFDAERRQPTPIGWACETVIWANLIAADGSLWTLRSADGAEQRVSVSRAGTPDAPELRIALDGHELTLVPGSKNDLLQHFEQTPEIAASKRRAFEHEMEQIAEARRRQAEPGSPPPAD